MSLWWLVTEARMLLPGPRSFLRSRIHPITVLLFGSFSFPQLGHQLRSRSKGIVNVANWQCVLASIILAVKVSPGASLGTFWKQR